MGIFDWIGFNGHWLSRFYRKSTGDFDTRRCGHSTGPAPGPLTAWLRTMGYEYGYRLVCPASIAESDVSALDIRTTAKLAKYPGSLDCFPGVVVQHAGRRMRFKGWGSRAKPTPPLEERRFACGPEVGTFKGGEWGKECSPLEERRFACGPEVGTFKGLQGSFTAR